MGRTGITKFLFSSKDAFVITQIPCATILDLSLSVWLCQLVFAIILSELRSKQMVKITNIYVVYFLSWVYHQFLYRCFPKYRWGLINHTLEALGMKGINHTLISASGRTSFSSGIWKALDILVWCTTQRSWVLISLLRNSDSRWCKWQRIVT